MTKKVSAKVATRLSVLHEVMRKWDRIYGLVEQAATSPKPDDLLSSVARGATDVARVLFNGGFPTVSDLVSQMANNARRGGMSLQKIRGLRETVAAVRTEVDRQQQMLITSEEGDEEEE